MFKIIESTITTPAGNVTYILHTPEAAQRAPQPALLLTFSSTRQASFHETPYDIPARLFAEAGHYVASFDLPNHGEQANAFGQGIAGMCAAFIGRKDPFVQFVAQGSAVIDACLAQGLGTSGGIFACGVSRAGYCALRLAASDRRIRGVAGLAPVTDWRPLTEFAAVRDQPEVAALALDHYANALAQRPVFLAIGNHDARVDTACCVRFALRLFELEREQAAGASAIQLYIVDALGHALADEWRAAGTKFLLRFNAMAPMD
jgi:dienelactone hydrolase